MNYKIPQWFKEWRANDYAHLEQNVERIKIDVSWIKKIGFLLFGAIIAAAIAILVSG